MGMAGWALVVLTAYACSPTLPDVDASTCPADLPQSCPSNVPSYKTDIAPIIATKCNGCHSDGGIGTGNFDYSTYANVYAARSAMLDQIYACAMPPGDAATLTDAERVFLLDWFVCHAPNN